MLDNIIKMMSETFYVGLYSALMAFVLAICAQFYRSKCKEVNFCCIKIIRDVEGEEQLDRNPNPIASQNNL